jgi:cytochrome c1
MSCAFCHASYHPLRPPRDPANPGAENLSGNIGAQYLRIRAVFGNLLREDSFVYHLLDSQPPGTVDTSLIASDNMNNPNTMNAVFGIPQRVVVSLRNPDEMLEGAAVDQPSLWRHPNGGAPPHEELDEPPRELQGALAAAGLGEALAGSNANPRRVPRILLDGADSIGAWGALARVYLNIGTYWEQWNRLHEPVVGFRPQRPFRIADANRNSVYWHATALRVAPMRDYFLVATNTMPLLEAGALPEESAPERETRLAGLVEAAQLERGRRVFARNCIMCHSSVQPEQWHADVQRRAERGELWDAEPGRWLRDADYQRWALAAVETDAFWRENYLSTDYRIPVTVVGTNACRALATNGMTGQMWEDFSSQTYRRLGSVGAIEYWNPYAGEHGAFERFEPRHRTPAGAPQGGGGPGYYRVPTLLTIWATAPFLHNNSLGLFNNDPSVRGRLLAFEDAMQRLLSPERRLASSSYNGATRERLQRDHGLIWRTPVPSYLAVPIVRLPFLEPLRAWLVRYEQDPAARRWVRWLRAAPPWLPPAALIAFALVILWRARRLRVRLLGYLALILVIPVAAAHHALSGRLGDLRVGPIPAGTPVNLLANLGVDQGLREVLGMGGKALAGLARIESEQLTSAEERKVLREEVGRPLLELSRCPDLVMDRGHYFPWFDELSEDDKRALIELLKTL